MSRGVEMLSTDSFGSEYVAQIKGTLLSEQPSVPHTSGVQAPDTIGTCCPEDRLHQGYRFPRITEVTRKRFHVGTAEAESLEPGDELGLAPCHATRARRQEQMPSALPCEHLSAPQTEATKTTSDGETATAPC